MTSGRAGPVRLALGWLAVVAVTATLTTTVVTRVGQDVAGELEQPLPSATAMVPSTTVTSTAGGSVAPRPATTGLSPDAGLPPTTGPGGTATLPPREPPTGTAVSVAPIGPVAAGRTDRRPADGDTGAGVQAPDGPPSTSGSPSGSATTAPTGGTASTSPTASFSATGGSLTARCSDGQVQLRSVTPSNGYRYEVEREDDGLRATFKSDAREDRLLVACRSGRPVLVLKDS
ncbi:hypothetical protein [Terracoccus sp. 273MFTsu3.1]|uniref:hypothetical protein n=1 Tax=Terracoccus sp. 273MFTsu3.1 TaxID=1172188 RepID=UPI00048BE6BC|nr:hypothetical protein [Terracoccus sp. 273MFTsu3.1]